MDNPVGSAHLATLLRRLNWRLPRTATAPFCPSEVRGQVTVRATDPLTKKITRFAGPGLLVAVGYMDPGNWATDLQAGSAYGMSLLWIVVFAGLAAILLQGLSARVGVVTGRDLAELCRDRYSPMTSKLMFLAAELAVVACDLAEVLGGALAFNLLLGVSLATGVALTALDTLLVLGLKGRGVRTLEAIVTALVATIALCFAVELFIVRPDAHAIIAGVFPDPSSLKAPQALYVAVGLIGATIMPHNLYLHSSLVQTRRIVGPRDPSLSLKLAQVDLAMALLAAMVINASILILAAAAFHRPGLPVVATIDGAWQLLKPIAGSAAAFLFAVALLASGQSSTFTGTIAGQVVLRGFIGDDRPCWQIRLATRTLALVPAMLGVIFLGNRGVGPLLVASQVLLGLQLPLALWPLIRISSDRKVMGAHVATSAVTAVAWTIFALVSVANVWLLLALIL